MVRLQIGTKPGKQLRLDLKSDAVRKARPSIAGEGRHLSAHLRDSLPQLDGSWFLRSHAHSQAPIQQLSISFVCVRR